MFREPPSKDCQVTVKCEKCRSNTHVTLMHEIQENHEQGKNNRGKKIETVLCSSTRGTAPGRYWGKTVLVDVFVPDNGMNLRVYAIIDEQSNNSFITSEFFDRLSVKCYKERYEISTITDEHYTTTGRVISNLQIRGVKQDEYYELPKLHESDFIPDTKRDVASPEMVKKIPWLSSYADCFPPIDKFATVSILIGRDSGILMQTKVLNDNLPVLHKTPLGFALVGSVCPASSKNSSVTLHTELEHFKVTNLFDDNVFKTFPDDNQSGLSIEDKRFLNIIENNVKVNAEGAIEMPLPLKNDQIIMPDNSRAVYNRQKNTIKQLKKEPEKLKQSLIFMQNLIDCRHVELVPESELTGPSGLTWYLPLFPVMHPKKNKLRLVFDGAAQYFGTSLNGCLLQGPDNNNKLRGVLARFREKEIGFIADVASMFHCFHVSPEHRDALRFYWMNGNRVDDELVSYRARVNIFGNTCSPSIATIGLRKAADLLKETLVYNQEEEKVVRYIYDNFYVDDGLGCAETPEEATFILKSAKEALSRFNIKLHKIVCNSPEVLDQFPESDRDNVSSVSLKLDDELIHRTLGVAWDVVTDDFTMKIDIPDRPFTKRGLLSVIGSIYDPIGGASPTVLGGKLIQRKIIPRKGDRNNCDHNEYGWDDPLPQELLHEWEVCKDSISDLTCIKIPRCLKPKNFGSIKERSLHVFSDASENAIGHVMYMKTTNSDNNHHLSFLYGESKVSPRSATTIPRLELCAAVVASESAYKITSELTNKPDKTRFYTDSKIVLGYVTNTERRFSQYVSRRIETILSVSNSDEWNYVSTGNNPADYASRATTGRALLNSTWLTGPRFLWDSDDSADVNDYSPLNFDDLPESIVESNHSLTTTKVENVISSLATRYSSFTKIVRITMTCLSAARIWLQKIGKQTLPKETCNVLLRTQAIETLVKDSQNRFNDVRRSLQTDKSLPPSHPLAKLGLFIDSNGLIRVGGRLANVEEIIGNVKHPLLLSHDDDLTLRILDYYHILNGHQGRQITNGAIRAAGFHIVKGKKLIKNFINRCVMCRKLRAKCEEQYMADLPADRLGKTAPFSKVGLDVMGHWNIHDGTTTRKSKSTKKTWAVLITCLYSRAIHVEPLPYLDTTSFQNAFRRFMAVRGHCTLIRSDRGTNFISATKDVDFFRIGDFLKDKGCEWKFNPPHSSHFGGVWERKIGQLRRSMDAALLKTSGRSLSRDELYTFLQEAASIVNATPMYDVSDDPNDPQPISPSMLLTYRETPIDSHDDFSDKDLLEYGKKRWRRVQFVADSFWKLWRNNYLSELAIRQKWLTKTSPLAKGDIVLLRDKGTKRNQWPLGMIDEVKVSSDNLIRSAKIKTVRCLKNAVVTYYERPISELVLLIRSSAKQRVENP